MNMDMDMDMNTLIDTFLPEPTPFDVAKVLFETKKETFSCKYYHPNIWIDKTNSTIPENIVRENLVSEIQTTVKTIFMDYNNHRPSPAVEKVITKLSNERYIRHIIREATELFYNN
jgi:hypothetical protein